MVVGLVALGLGGPLVGWAAAQPVSLALEMEARNWRPCELDAGSRAVKVVGESSTLQITGELPAFGASYRCPENWEGYAALSFELRVPAGFPAHTDLQVYLKDFHYYWYQVHPLREAEGKAQPLAAEKWIAVKLPLTPFNSVWQPGGHRKIWYDAWVWPKELGIRFFGQGKGSGTVEVRNLRLEDYREQETSPPSAPRPVAAAQAVPQYEKFELTWPVERYYSNPYDPEVVEVEGHFLAPSGQRITVPGFFYQGYERTRTAQGHEKLIPVGAPEWKVRFAPRETGTYRYFVTLKDMRGEAKSAEGKFETTAALQPRGLAQISEEDPRYFEWENGEFLYPGIINMRDGGDQAEAQAGTYEFEEFFPRFRERGISVVRTWMAAWWAGIEWSQAYHSRYGGVGGYAQYNAWRLDYTFDLAAEHDLYLELTLGSHGQLRQDKFDAEWDYNPYSVENGGYLPAPYMFFSSARAREDMKQRYRYIVARWGYSRNLFSYDLWNEIDLSEGYSPRESAAWHQEMARYLRALDPNPHLITSHIALYWQAGDELWQLPEIQYLQSDSYWKRRDVGMNESFGKRSHYQKPFVFIEYGPQTVELPVPESRWLQEFRSGMWVSSMMPWSAPGAFWYNREWEAYRLWEFQGGMQAFWTGEERRGKGYRSTQPHLQNGEGLNVQAMMSEEAAFLYVYDFEGLGKREPSPGAGGSNRVTAHITGLQPGTYTVEFWNTLTGEITSRSEATCTERKLALPLPPVVQDLAIKIRRAG